MSWFLLMLAGLLEIAWATALPSTSGFTRPLPTVIVLASLAASMVLLAKAAETIPLGTAYAVWVGIGAVGVAVTGLLLHGDPAAPTRLAFLGLLVVSIVGLRLTSS